jgi:3-methyl-2-oxobutanoate hydroxymethyltransferase
MTADKIRALKGQRKISALTAYDYASAKLLDAAGIDLILVGDSLAMTVLGHENTLAVTMDEMLHHTRAAARGTKQALLAADMPFMSYQVSEEKALENAFRFIKEGHADAVKIEGGSLRVPLVQTLTDNDIPVMGHVGLTPQSVKGMGGFKVQGKQADQADKILQDAIALDEAGVFTLVLEGIPAELGQRISAAVKVPTIGIGAGAGCDGQILVFHDLLGMYSDMTPHFVKQYADVGQSISTAVTRYIEEVREGVFPGPEHSY